MQERITSHDHCCVLQSPQRSSLIKTKRLRLVVGEAPSLHPTPIIAWNAGKRNTVIMLCRTKKSRTQFPHACISFPAKRKDLNCCLRGIWKGIRMRHIPCLQVRPTMPPTKFLIKTKRLCLIVRESLLLHLVLIIAWIRDERNTTITLSCKKTGNSVPAPLMAFLLLNGRV